jgi:cytochrome c oxidase assembly protein subunit 15
MQKANHWLHRFAMLVVGATLGLIFVGGLVTTRDAGMSVPDWPTSFHYSMFAVPFAKWLGADAMESGVFYEHSHRLFASLVGTLTLALTIWLWVAEPRRWLKWLGTVASLLVIAQGILGGLRVTHASLTLAMIHGCTAQAFLCVLVIIAASLSTQWTKLANSASLGNFQGIFRTAWLLVAAVYTQLIIGAVMRHMKAGLAIPTFPKSGLRGEWIPPYWNEGVALNFAHRIGALVVTVIVITLVSLIFIHASRERFLTRPAKWLGILLLTQIYLGSNIILRMRPPTLTTLHVVTGAIILGTSLLIALRVSLLASTAGNKEAAHELSHGRGRATA